MKEGPPIIPQEPKKPGAPNSQETPRKKDPASVARGVKSWEIRDNKLATKISEELDQQGRPREEAILNTDIVNALRRDIGRKIREIQNEKKEEPGEASETEPKKAA